MELIKFIENTFAEGKRKDHLKKETFIYSIFPSVNTPLCIIDRRSLYPLLFFLRNLLIDRIHKPSFFQSFQDLLIKLKRGVSLLFFDKVKLELSTKNLFARIKGILCKNGIINDSDNLNIILCTSLRTSTRYTLFAFLHNIERPIAIVKIVTSPDDKERLKEEYKILTSFKKKISTPAMRCALPEAYFLYSLDSKTTLLGESYVGGRRLSSVLKKSNIDNHIRNVVESIIEINKSYAYKIYVDRFPDDYFSDLGNAIYSSSAKYKLFSDSYTNLIPNGEREFIRTIMHSDVTPRNIFISRGKYYLIDWEYAKVDGFPFFDLFHMLLRSVSYTFRLGFFESFKKVFYEDGTIKYFSIQIIRHYSKEMLIESRLTVCYLFFYLVRWQAITSIFKDDINKAINLLIENKLNLF